MSSPGFNTPGKPEPAANKGRPAYVSSGNLLAT
jgi:hypothetical protein